MDVLMRKNRNQTVDFLKGIAILLVVLGHTMGGVAADAYNSFLFNVVWTLQMPLFMLISGYILKYSKPIENARGLWQFFYKKSLAYLFPWAVWTFLIRGCIWGQTEFFNLRYLLFNMDAGYWFLFSLWTIVVLCGLARYFADKIVKSDKKWANAFVTTGFELVAAGLLAVIGFTRGGGTLLGIKLTLYYTPFYFLAFLYGRLEEDLIGKKWFPSVKDGVIAVAFIGWIILLRRYNFYTVAENPLGILLRATASILGCVAVCGFVSAFLRGKELQNGKNAWICAVGARTMQIYLIHGLLLNSIVSPITVFASLEGILLTAVNFFLTTLASYAVIVCVEKNKFLNKILFWK